MMTYKTHTQDDFESLSWHDSMIHGISFTTLQEDDDASTLSFDIDFVDEWLLQKDSTYLFKVCPATVTFRDITDLSVSIGRDFFCGLWILGVMRSEDEKNSTLEKPFWRWRFELDEDDSIEFGSSGFTQTLRKEPVVRARQRLLTEER
jgi:hypothetical protein